MAIAFFGLVLLAIIAYAGWSANQTAVERERTLLDNALNQSIARVLNEQKSVAWWDDSVLNITDDAIDLDFVDANFGIFLTETYAQDEVYILNAKDKPLYAWANEARAAPSSFERVRPAIEAVIDEARQGKLSPQLKTRPDSFSESQSSYRLLAGVLGVARWAGHIMTVNGRPAVVAALTIVPNVQMDLLKGTPNLLVSIRYIDKDFISEIGRTLLLPDLALKKQPVEGGAVVSEPFITDDGVQAGYLSWTTRQPGQVLLTIILPLVAFGVLATGLLSKIMFGRLRRASTALAQREFDARYEAKHDRAVRPAEPRPHGREDRQVPQQLHRAAQWPTRARGLYRHRPLQGHQRHAGPRGRRRTDQSWLPSGSARGSGRTTSSRALAATSS